MTDRAATTTPVLASWVETHCEDATDALHMIHSLVEDVVDEWQRLLPADGAEYERADGFRADARGKLLEALDHVRRARRDAHEIQRRGAR